jgi:hypothetical protein
MDAAHLTVPAPVAYDPGRDGMLKVPDPDKVVITDVTPWAMASSLASLTSYHKPVTGPLFLAPPNVSDINQQSIGDCWFLASICAILCLPNGTMRVWQMMRERDGYVFVRLYDRSRQAHYLKLEKTVIHHDSGSEFHAKLDAGLGTWPVFLEKALTAFDSKGNFDPAFARYGRTEGGFGDRGLARLLGVETVRVPIAPPAVDKVTEVGQEVDQVLGVLFSVGVDPNAGAARATLIQIFGASYEKDWADWQKWLKTQQHRDLRKELWQAILGKQELRTHKLWKRHLPAPQTSWRDLPSWTTAPGGVFRLEHLQTWFGRLTPPPPPHLSIKVISCARMSHLLPGKRGTGLYADSQLQTFNLMRNLCLAGVPMTVGSRVYLGKSTETYHYSDELIKGLVSSHEYAVHNVFSKDNRCYIKLMNPWGRAGRAVKKGAYAVGKSEPVEATEDAEFDLDLDDFTKRFNWLSHTTGPPPAVVFDV